MGLKTDTLFDDRAAARRNRVIYVVCALVVAGCAVAFLVISSGGGKDRPGPVDEGSPVATGPTTTGDGPGAAGASMIRNDTESPSDPDGPGGRPGFRGPEVLREADAKLEAALDFLRNARDLGPGSKEGTALKHKALKALLSAQTAYDQWLEAHPEDEDRYAAKISDIQRQIFWTRKNMPATDFPDSPEGAKEPDPIAEGPKRPATPVDVPKAGPTRPKPTVPPDRLIQQFGQLTKRALRQGKPAELAAAGRELLEDERLAKWHAQIRQVVTAAEGMVAFLDSAAKALSDRVGETVELDLRNGQVSGELLRAGDEIAVRQGGSESVHAVTDLSAGMLVALATEAEFLTSGYGHRVAGAYLFNRGDRGPGLEQLIRARAQGENVGPYELQIQGALKNSRPLQALVAWLELELRLDDPGEELLGQIAAFRSKYRGTPLFLEHREEIFRAAATAAEIRPFEVEHLWSGEKKLSGRGRVKLAWDFDDAAQLRDFEVQGKWRIEGGALVGENGRIRLERFDLATSEITFGLPAPMPVTIGLWHRDRNGRGAVNLTVVPEGGQVKVTLRHGDRPIGGESVRAPTGRLEFTIQRRDEKYQVKLNRKVLFKGTDIGRRAGDKLYAVGIAVRDGAVEISDLAIATTVDTDWAEAGGHRFATWIRDWYVGPVFPVTQKSRKLALATEQWPETKEFDAAAKGADGKPLWRAHTARDHWVDLNFLRPNRNAIAYQQVRVWSPSKRNAVFEIVADDLAQAWLNGDLVVPEAPLAERMRVPVKLLPGDNLLLIKVLQADGGWYSATRFLTKDGGPMRDLQYW